MDELNSIFQKEFEARSFPKSFAEKIEEDAFQEFKEPIECVERKIDKEKLLEKKLKLIKQLNNCKNIKNPRTIKQNQAIADKRKRLKQQIAEVDMDLEDLKTEEKGHQRMRGQNMKNDNEKPYNIQT